MLQGKLRRAERMLKQKEIRISELQSRCRHADKERGNKVATASKQQSQSAQQQQQQPADVNKHT